MDYQTLIYLYNQHAWTAVFVLVIGYFVTLLSDQSRFPAFVPSRWRPAVVAVLALSLTAGQALLGGLPWRQVVLRALVTGFTTMGLFDLVVNGFWNGAPPRWVAWLALMLPKGASPIGSKLVLVPPTDTVPVQALVSVVPDEPVTVPVLVPLVKKPDPPPLPPKVG